MAQNFEQYTEISELLKALAHPVRLCIVRGLIEKNGCNVTHMQSCLDLPQSTVSQHLQKLKSVGIIIGVRTGLEIKYSICDQRIIELVKALFIEKPVQ